MSAKDEFQNRLRREAEALKRLNEQYAGKATFSRHDYGVVITLADGTSIPITVGTGDPYCGVAVLIGDATVIPDKAGEHPDSLGFPGAI